MYVCMYVCSYVLMLPNSSGTAGPIWLIIFLLAPSWSRFEGESSVISNPGSSNQGLAKLGEHIVDHALQMKI